MLFNVFTIPYMRIWYRGLFWGERTQIIIAQHILNLRLNYFCMVLSCNACAALRCILTFLFIYDLKMYKGRKKMSINMQMSA